MEAVLPSKNKNFANVCGTVNKCTWHFYPLGYRNETKIFELFIAKVAHIFSQFKASFTDY